MLCRRFAVALIMIAGLASPVIACTITASPSSMVGPYSPAAVKASAVPTLSNSAGLSCSSALLLLLSGNYIRAKFTSLNGLKLKRVGGAETVSYAASADAGATVSIAQGATIDYMQNNLLNLLGLLGNSNANLPFYIKPNSTVIVPTGTYEDTVTVNWDWNLCTGKPDEECQRDDQERAGCEGTRSVRFEPVGARGTGYQQSLFLAAHGLDQGEEFAGARPAHFAADDRDRVRLSPYPVERYRSLHLIETVEDDGTQILCTRFLARIVGDGTRQGIERLAERSAYGVERRDTIRIASEQITASIDLRPRGQHLDPAELILDL
jgi:hypothetical protein